MAVARTRGIYQYDSCNCRQYLHVLCILCSSWISDNKKHQKKAIICTSIYTGFSKYQITPLFADKAHETAFAIVKEGTPSWRWSRTGDTPPSKTLVMRKRLRSTYHQALLRALVWKAAYNPQKTADTVNSYHNRSKNTLLYVPVFGVKFKLPESAFLLQPCLQRWKVVY